MVCRGVYVGTNNPQSMVTITDAITPAFVESPPINIWSLASLGAFVGLVNAQ